MKDEIFCLFEGALDNLGSLRQQYGLAKMANESILVIEAYKALRDRAPYPPNHVVAHLSGNFAFVVFDKSTSTLFVASVSSRSVAPLEKTPDAGEFIRDGKWWVPVTGPIWEGSALLGNNC